MSRPNTFRQPVKMRAAQEWLSDYLSTEGVQPTHKVVSRGRELGFQYRTLNRAKNALGIYSINRNNRFYWSVEADPVIEVVVCPTCGR